MFSKSDGPDLVGLYTRSSLCRKYRNVCVRVCVYFLYILSCEDLHAFLSNRVRTFLGSEDILAGLHFVRL